MVLTANMAPLDLHTSGGGVSDRKIADTGKIQAAGNPSTAEGSSATDRAANQKS